MNQPRGVKAVIGLALCGLALIAAAPPTTRADQEGELRGASGIEELPPKPPVSWWPVWLGVGIVGAASAGLLAWRYSRRPPPTIVLAPADWALQQLDAIDNQQLPLPAAAERYHTLISDVIREYLEMRFRLHAPRQTTEEFLRSMQQSPHLSAEQQKLLSEFLQRCDLAKFARADFSLEECRRTADMARSFVRPTAAG